MSLHPSNDTIDTLAAVAVAVSFASYSCLPDCRPRRQAQDTGRKVQNASRPLCCDFLHEAPNSSRRGYSLTWMINGQADDATVEQYGTDMGSQASTANTLNNHSPATSNLYPCTVCLVCASSDTLNWLSRSLSGRCFCGGGWDGTGNLLSAQ